jgi:hypothetical protein
MNVLVACEESQRVCTSFRDLGHTAWSCDIQPCSGGHPEWHILGDCIPIIGGGCTFTTEAGGYIRRAARGILSSRTRRVPTSPTEARCGCG